MLTFIINIFKYTEKLEAFYSESPYIRYLNSASRVLLYMLSHISKPPLYTPIMHLIFRYTLK